MYESHYGLKSRPFQLTPDPHYYFESLTHRKALSYLGYGLAQGEGFIVITGDVGAGKTTLVGHLMATIDKARLTAANIVTTKLDSQDIVRVAANHFDIDTDNMNTAQLLSAIEEFLHNEARAGRRCLLIVDEAQNLPAGALEELRMLSNFQLGGQALLQIFLLGQPEFRELLKNSNQLEQLRQRVIAQHHLEPMGSEEIEPYITHRLLKSGWSGRPKITSDVYGILYSETAGVPRKINTLMSRVMLMGAVEHTELIDQDLVVRVLADLSGDTVDTIVEEESSTGHEAVLDERPLSTAGSVQQTAQEIAAAEAMRKEALQKEVMQKEALQREAAQKEAMRKQAMQKEAMHKSATLAAVEKEVATLRLGGSDQPQDAKTDQHPALSQALAQRIDIISKRLSLLETRMNKQDENLHHVLTVLIDWVENDVRNKERHVNEGRAA